MAHDRTSDDSPDASIDAVDDDRPASQLDDLLDRKELRQRYFGLLQELRVLLPGVQLLLAFLLAAPFASRFGELDRVDRTAFGVAICAAMAATVSFVSPTAFHRIAGRRERSARLVWAIRCLVLGLAFLAVALIAALFCISRFVFGTSYGIVMTAVLASMILVFWVVVPFTYRERDRPTAERPTSS